MNCVDCGCKLRVETPNVFGGEYRCWSCHPVGRDYLLADWEPQPKWYRPTGLSRYQAGELDWRELWQINGKHRAKRWVLSLAQRPKSLGRKAKRKAAVAVEA